MPPRDPRLRPYRIAAWVGYFAVIAVLAVLVVGSIARSLRGRPRLAPAGAPPTRAALRVCLGDLEALYREENQRAWRLGAELAEASDQVGAWNDWSSRWEERVEDLSNRCRLDVANHGALWVEERTELAAARDAMLALHRAYRAQVNRFAQEHWDLARATAEAMLHAREAVTRAR